MDGFSIVICLAQSQIKGSPHIAQFAITVSIPPTHFEDCEEYRDVQSAREHSPAQCTVTQLHLNVQAAEKSCLRRSDHPGSKSEALAPRLQHRDRSRFGLCWVFSVAWEGWIWRAYRACRAHVPEGVSKCPVWSMSLQTAHSTTGQVHLLLVF